MTVLEAMRNKILISIRTHFSTKLSSVVDRSGAVLQSNSFPLDAFMRDLANNIAQGLDPELDDQRDDAQRELEAVRAVDYRALLLAKLRTSNLNTWLEHEAVELGTETHRERYARNELAEEDLLQLVREEVFKPYRPFIKWQPLKWSGVAHLTGCTGHVELGVVVQTDEPREIDTYMRMIEVSAMLADYHPWFTKTGNVPNISVRRHFAKCTKCSEMISALSALVTIPWAGRTLSREYAL